MVSKLLQYEDLLTDNQETDFTAPKKRRKNTNKASNKVNGIMGGMMSDMDHDGSSSWNDDADEQHDPSWTNDDYDMGNNEDNSYENANHEESEVNIKPRLTPRSVGIKITSVASTKSVVVDDLSDSGMSNLKRQIFSLVY